MNKNKLRLSQLSVDQIVNNVTSKVSSHRRTAQSLNDKKESEWKTGSKESQPQIAGPFRLELD
jgi:hypothetical protein